LDQISEVSRLDVWLYRKMHFCECG